MSFFKCSCGAKILVIPDLYLMGQTIKRHIMEHYRLSGRRFTDETLTEILKALYTQMWGGTRLGSCNFMPSSETIRDNWLRHFCSNPKIQGNITPWRHRRKEGAQSRKHSVGSLFQNLEIAQIKSTQSNNTYTNLLLLDICCLAPQLLLSPFP